MNEKRQEYPQSTDMIWFANLTFFYRFYTTLQCTKQTTTMCWEDSRKCFVLSKHLRGNCRFSKDEWVAEVFSNSKNALKIFITFADNITSHQETYE